LTLGGARVLDAAVTGVIISVLTAYSPSSRHAV
jgi:hypothetical protein